MKKLKYTFFIAPLLFMPSLIKPLSAQATPVDDPTQLQELEVMTQLEQVVSGLSATMNDFFFLNFASTIPQAAAISSYGGNSIDFMTPNPYFHLQITSGLSIVFPLVNFKSVDFNKTFSSQNEVNDAFNLGPVSYIAKQTKAIGVGVPTNILHFGARISFLGISDILDRFDFGISYATPHIPFQSLDDLIGSFVDFKYRSILELYGASLRYRVYENNVTSISVGASFNYLAHTFSAQQQINGIDVSRLRTRRQQVLIGQNNDALYPLVGPYTLDMFYKLQSSFKATTVDLFFRADFGIVLIKPFIDIGISIRTSERLLQSSEFLNTLYEDASINPTGTIDERNNIIVSDSYRYVYRPSGISVITPRISVGLNALRFLNVRFSFTLLRAENFLPSFGVATTLNFDF